MVKIKNNKKAFTLVEILLASTIFVVIMTLGIAAFSTIINWKKKTSSVNDLQAAGRHAIEVMTQAIEQADLNTPIPGRQTTCPPPPFPCTPDGTFYGFRINIAGYGGPVTTSTSLIIYHGVSSNTLFHSVGNTLLQDSISLLPSNVRITALNFSGFQKTGGSITANYQQPYVTINMTLQSTNPDPVDGTYKSASFQTTAKPQNFDRLGLAEVQSGLANNVSSSSQQLIFPHPFSAVPNVVFNRQEYYKNDDNTQIDSGSITATKFNFQAQYNQTKKISWLAVNGNFPYLLQSGIISSGSAITYPKPFLPTTSLPKTLFSRLGGSGSDDQMNYIVNNSTDSPKNTGLTLGGDNVDKSHQWVSVNLDKIFAPNGKKVIEAGKKSSKNDIYCKTQTVSIVNPFGIPNFLTGYFCNLKGYFASNPAQVMYTPPHFNSPPAVLLSNYANFNGLYSAYDDRFNIPGIQNNSATSFYYYNDNPAGNDDTYIIDTAKVDQLKNYYGIYWVAINTTDFGSFKLLWSYE